MEQSTGLWHRRGGCGIKENPSPADTDFGILWQHFLCSRTFPSGVWCCLWFSLNPILQDKGPSVPPPPSPVVTFCITVRNGRTEMVMWVPGVSEVIVLLPMCSSSAILSPVQAGVAATVETQMGLSPGPLPLFPALSLCSGNTDLLVPILCYLMSYNEIL